MELNEIRTRIDEIDTQLVDLYVRRMQVVAEVAESKRESGKAVRDHGRERAVLNRLTAQAGDALAPYVRDLYHLIFQQSRSYQASLLDQPSPLIQSIQAACAVRRGSVPLGYVVADVTAAQLTALFDGQHTATSRLLLLDPFWDQVYASSDLPAKTLAARLRSQLLAGQALSDSHGAYDYFVRQEPRSGFCLVLQQPKPMTEGTAELMYLVAGLSLLLCLGLCVLASMRFSRQLFEPIRALNSAMREVEEGNLNVQLDNRRIDEMGQLSGRFNRMAQRLRQNLKDSLRQQRELNEAQIRMMQAQLNPHFLYNTLDTIKWMGKIHQAPEIATISADLADILRSSISADELVPLRQELRLVGGRMDDVRQLHMYDVVGCGPSLRDRISDRQILPSVKAGDLIALLDVGVHAPNPVLPEFLWSGGELFRLTDEPPFRVTAW